MDFIKHINETFDSIEFVNNEVLSEKNIENMIQELEVKLLDTMQNLAGSPIVIERMAKTIKELEESDLEGLNEQDKAEIIGAIKHHKIQQQQNIDANDRAREDIAYYQTLITNWRKVLDKFTK